jgi:hypothetical protein
VARQPAGLEERIVEIVRFTIGISEDGNSAKGKAIFCTCNFFSEQPSFHKYGF